MKHCAAFFETKWKWSDYFKYKYWKSWHLAVCEAKNYQIASDEVLVVKNLSAWFVDYNYHTNVVIKNFSFHFKAKHIYCIIGKSGSGKTTLVNHFNGLMKSTRGNIYLANNKPILFFKRKIRNFKKIRKQISMVFQSPEYQLFKETVLKDVSYGPKVLGVEKTKILPQSVKQLLDMGMTEEFFNSNPFNLSGGQKRKVALAGIFAIDPNIVIFDEPTVGLDPVSEKEIINLIKNLKVKGKTVIVISHNINHVLELADEVLLLDQGQLITATDPFTMFRNQKLLTQYNILEPRIVEIINGLIKLNSEWKALWAYKPRTAQSLSIAIKKWLQKSHD